MGIMSSSFCKFLIQNRLLSSYQNALYKIGMQYQWMTLTPSIAMNGSFNQGTSSSSILCDAFDGLLFTQRNSKVPSKANHGARPCSHVYRRIKVECNWYGPRWFRKSLKKKFRNAENKIYP